jgi:hypothetical protein
VNPTRPPNTTEHPEELLLPYVENLLSGDDRAMVEEHVRTCRRCASTAEELRNTVSLLRQHRGAFCPEPWELYEYVHYGVQPDAALREHLDRCDACRAVMETLTSLEPAEAIPSAVLEKIRGGRPRSTEIRLRGPARWWDVLHRFFRRPVFGAAAAAVAVALVVFALFPREVSQYPMALSSVAWESTPKPKAFAPSMPRVAVVLAVRQCSTPLPQRTLDSLYEGLAPTMDLYERFQILSPAMVRNALRKVSGPIDSRERLLEDLRSRMDVSLACLVTIECKGEQFNVQAEVVDTTSGAVRASRTQSGVSPSKLETEVRRATHLILLSAAGYEGVDEAAGGS